MSVTEIVILGLCVTTAIMAWSHLIMRRELNDLRRQVDGHYHRSPDDISTEYHLGEMEDAMKKFKNSAERLTRTLSGKWTEQK